MSPIPQMTYWKSQLEKNEVCEKNAAGQVIRVFFKLRQKVGYMS